MAQHVHERNPFASVLARRRPIGHLGTSTATQHGTITPPASTMNDMSDTTWRDYMRDTISPDTLADVARRLNIARSTIGRWDNGQIPSPQEVIRFARVYNRSPVRALTAAGYLDPSDETQTDWNVTAAPTDALLNEIRRRINR